MPYRYPAWANGTAAVAAARGSDAEVSFQFWDRMTPRGLAALPGQRAPVLVYDPRRAGLEYRLPDEGHGPQSAWARFFEFLYDRYHLGQRESGRYVRAFELVNEPNLQLWPQQAPPIDGSRFAPTETTAPRAVADIMITAQAISARYDHSTLLLAPSLSDIDVAGGRRSTTYGQFARAAARRARRLRLPRARAPGVVAPQLRRRRVPHAGRPQRRGLMDQLRGRWHGGAASTSPRAARA